MSKKINQIEEKLKGLQSVIENLYKDRDDLLNMLRDAMKTIDNLTNCMPKLISDVGAAMCKISETILPGETAVIIKMSSSAYKFDAQHKCTVHILGEKEGITLEDFKYYLASAHRIAQSMENENGILVAKNDCATN